MSIDNLFEKFYKYQSLGNHFIIFDWQNFDSQEIILPLINSSCWASLVKKICDTKKGIGADVVLVLHDKKNMRVSIFNADGTEAENCLNGIRCIAYHISLKRNEPTSKFTLTTIVQKIICTVNDNNILTISPHGIYSGPLTITSSKCKISGHIVSTGNPHFIILQKCTPKWLAQYGSGIENNESFSHKTNVEFVWQSQKNSSDYHMLIHERGVGMTAACSSGAAATAWLLFKQKMIKPRDNITLLMPGGEVKAWITQEKTIALQADAECLYTGRLFPDYIDNLLENC